MLRASLAGALLALALASPARSAEPPRASATAVPLADAMGHPAQVSIDDTLRINFVSKVNGRPYSLMVCLPQAPPPPRGYPVIYVLDGDELFGSFCSATRQPTEPTTIVVGIGYQKIPSWIKKQIAKVPPGTSLRLTAAPFDQAVNVARFYDLTPQAGPEPSVRETGLTPADVGGAARFLRVIETEVKPRIDALTKVDQSRQALFGHSLGGLFVLYALFTAPHDFTTYIASSPSIYWANSAVLSYEAAFKAQVEAGTVAPRILIAVGGEEESIPARLPPSIEAHRAEFAADVKSKHMISANCGLAARLRALHGAPGYEVAECAVAAHIWHVLAVWASLARALEFIAAQP